MLQIYRHLKEIEKPKITKLRKIEFKEKYKKKSVLKRKQHKVFKDIFFEYDKSKILLKSERELIQLLRFLNKNKDLIVELSSYTDCRGSDKYNLALSQHRTEATKKWLTDRGIDSNRIKAKGYGETRLLNHCKDGVQCSEAEHKVNRRTKFKIISKSTISK